MITPGMAKGYNEGDAGVMKLLGKLVPIIKQVHIQDQTVYFFFLKYTYMGLFSIKVK